MPRVSVVMTCFNHQQYVADAISSILQQDYQDWELIVIDDGSQDRSVKIAQSFDDSRITVFSGQNRGPSDACNSGICRATGEFIVLASADDEFEANLISRQLCAIDAASADVSFCLPTLIDKRGRELPDGRRPAFFKTSFSCQEELYFKLFSLGNFLLAPGAMIRRSLFSEFGSFQAGLYQLQDFDLWVRLAPHCKMLHITDRLVRYRLIGDEANLSARPDPFYIGAEYRIIYQHFFDNVARKFVRHAFSHVIDICTPGDEIDRALETSLLLMTTRRAPVQALGLEQAIASVSQPAAKERFRKRFDIGPAELRHLSKSISGADPLLRELWGRHNVEPPKKRARSWKKRARSLAKKARSCLRYLQNLYRPQTS